MAQARSIQRRTVLACCAAALVAGMAPAIAQDAWPSKPIKLVVPFPPGGGTDIVARMIARRLGPKLGVAIVIDNRPGADGVIGTQLAVNAEPDGYTMLIDGPSQAFNVAFGKQLPYKASVDLIPVVQTSTQQLVLIVNPKLPVTSVAQLVDYAKKNPGKLSYGASSNASALPMELFKVMTGTNIVHIPYKGSGPLLTDLLGGQVELSMAGAATPMEQVRAGKLRLLAVGDSQRSPTFPQYPTIDEGGVKGFEAIHWTGLYLPKGTSPEIVRKLNAAVVEVLAEPGLKKEMQDAAFDPVRGANTPELWRRWVQSETDKWTAIVKKTGLKAD